MEVEVWGRSRRADVSMQMQKRSQRCSLVQIWGLRPLLGDRVYHLRTRVELLVWDSPIVLQLLKVLRGRGRWIPWSGQEAQMARKNGGTVIKWSRESAWLESSACSFCWQCTQPCMAQQNEFCNSGESISFPLRHQLPRPQSTLMTHFLKPHHTLGNGSSEWATGAIIMGLLLTYQNIWWSPPQPTTTFVYCCENRNEWHCLCVTPGWKLKACPWHVRKYLLFPFGIHFHHCQ